MPWCPLRHSETSSVPYIVDPRTMLSAPHLCCTTRACVVVGRSTGNMVETCWVRQLACLAKMDRIPLVARRSYVLYTCQLAERIVVCSPKMMASMEAHRPWSESEGPSPRNPVYNAWHIRTSDGETRGSFRTKHTSYIFHKQSSARVCPLYLSTVEALTWVCPELFAENGLEVPIYISSNRCGPGEG